ncbi:MAG TPA: hypothetical protein VGI84_12475 [Pseudonocardiaceae bacterium]|jgi:hypothetical protein
MGTSAVLVRMIGGTMSSVNSTEFGSMSADRVTTCDRRDRVFRPAQIGVPGDVEMC